MTTIKVSLRAEKTKMASQSAARKEFEDPVEATDHIADTYALLADKRLLAYAKTTDGNFRTKTLPLLKAAIKAFDAFSDAMEKAAD